jgi:intein-encoded DNA endonuclease-like protein
MRLLTGKQWPGILKISCEEIIIIDCLKFHESENIIKILNQKQAPELSQHIGAYFRNDLIYSDFLLYTI